MLATQCLPRLRPRTMRIVYRGELPLGVTPKDVILGTIGRIGVDGASGHVLEYAGEAIRSLSMEGRMTICNMSIEAGARAGLIAPGRHDVRIPRGPTGGSDRRRLGACARSLARAADGRRRRLRPRARDRRDRARAAGDLGNEPRRWSSPSEASCPIPPSTTTPTSAPRSSERSMYMGLEPGTPLARHRDRPRLHRLVHERADRGPPRRGRGRRRQAGAPARPRDGRARARWRSSGKPRRKGSTASSRPRGSSGAAPAARCAWA